MRSNYKKLGNYIQQVDLRNKNLKVSNLLGVSISKVFMPSIANTVGTDMSKYKIVRNKQFAYGPVTSRNGDKISIALLEDDEAICSVAYTVFEIIDKQELNPEYLMMWFCRPEFDRYARYKSHGSARETFDWDEMCNVELPVPDIEKQREIVREYNVIVDRIKLNEKMCEKLEETARAIYREWFVEFEFPVPIAAPQPPEGGGIANPTVVTKGEQKGRSPLGDLGAKKGYKSSGGEMVWSEELEKDVPKGWEVKKLDGIAEIKMGQSPSGESYNFEKKGEIFYQGRTEFGFRFPTIKTYTTAPKRMAKKGDILMSVRAPVGDLNVTDNDCCIGRGIASLRSKENFNSYLFYLLKDLKSEFDISDKDGTVFGSINKDDLNNIKVSFPELNILKVFDKQISVFDEKIKNLEKQNQNLQKLKDLLLSKMAK